MVQGDLHGSQDDLGHFHVSPSPQAKAARKAKEAPKLENAEDTPTDAMENPTTQTTPGMTTGTTHGLTPGQTPRGSRNEFSARRGVRST